MGHDGQGEFLSEQAPLGSFFTITLCCRWSVVKETPVVEWFGGGEGVEVAGINN